ncbi:orexin receptor type 2-like [Paramacrobiotus metropolitanus]|uniref:orexin receptor type 2-like n=1 Tax=Paramacrobiotus metropolitanus TaxID=2943436 RepID=UPI0024457E5E|nr:orexin receptor type 2-like [Paramacrobiotus metropolitanus]
MDGDAGDVLLDPTVIVAGNQTAVAAGYLSPANCTNSSNTYCLSDDDYMEFVEAYVFPTILEWFLIALSSIIFLVGTAGNILVIISVVRNPSMRSVTNHFIVNLSVADFLVLMICLPPTVLWDVTETWFLGSLMCQAVLFCQRVCVSVSVLTFFCIAVDRWSAIVIPLRFASTAFRAKIAVVMTWVLSIGVSLPELVYLDVKPSFLPIPSIYFTQCVAHWSDSQETGYQIFILLALYLLPISIMTVLYGQIVYALWWRALPKPPEGSALQLSAGAGSSGSMILLNGKYYNNIAGSNPTGTVLGVPAARGAVHVQTGSTCLNGRSLSSTVSNPVANSQSALIDNQIRSRRKVAMMLIISVALFAFCYLPVHTLNILRSTVGLPNTPIWVTVSLLVHWICYMQNTANPIIYYVMSEKFRREFNRIFRCCMALRPARYMRRNSSEVFQCGRPPQPTYYHTLGLARRTSSVNQKCYSENGKEIVQL